MLNLVATKHAHERARLRCSWHHRTLDRMLARIIYFGLAAEDCSGALHRYLRSLCANRKFGCVRVYGEQVYIFARGDEENTFALITVLHLPRAIRAAAHRAFRQHQALAA